MGFTEQSTYLNFIKDSVYSKKIYGNQWEKIWLLSLFNEISLAEILAWDDV